MTKQELLDKSLKTLEYDKILKKISEFAFSSDTKDKIEALKPFVNIDKVNKNLDDTNDALLLMYKLGAPSLSGIKNMLSSVARAGAGASLTIRELLDIKTNLSIARKLKKYIDEGSNIKTSINHLFFQLVSCNSLERAISDAFVSEEEVSDHASPELFSIRKKIAAANSKVRDVLQKIITNSSSQKYLQDNIVTIRNDRFVVPVKSEYKSEIKGLIHDSSASGSTVFIEPFSAVEANNAIRELKIKEKKEIERIIFDLSMKTAEFSSVIINNYKLMCEIDFIFAKAKYAEAIKGVRAHINNCKKINFKNARHPLIDSNLVVPTNIYIGGDFDCLIITGPNTGGKTVTLKTLGLLCAMTASGLFIPANEGSEACVFEMIFSDIGDEQSIEQSLSTFSSHMTNIVEILKYADENSLVLFDELGAGTDPIEGAALARAILDTVRIRGAISASTTHYSELKTFALTTNGVENASCEFDVNTLKPTYRLLIGIPGKSNAFAISERLGLAQGIVKNAKQFVSSENTKIEDILAKLEQTHFKMEEEQKKAEAYREEVQKIKFQHENEIEKLVILQEKELENARIKAKRIVEKTKINAEKIISELDEIRKKKDSKDFNRLLADSKGKLRQDISKLEDEADPKIKRAPYKLPRKLLLGDTVELIEANVKGDVINLPDKNGNMTIKAGIMKMKVNVKDVKLIESKKLHNPQKYLYKTNIDKSKISVKMECDLRGMTVLDAVEELDKFIDNALLSGLSQISIIHGKGTGALRSAVNEYLRSKKHIKSFRLGAFGEGDTGVTIAELK